MSSLSPSAVFVLTESRCSSRLPLSPSSPFLSRTNTEQSAIEEDNVRGRNVNQRWLQQLSCCHEFQSLHIEVLQPSGTTDRMYLRHKTDILDFF